MEMETSFCMLLAFVILVLCPNVLKAAGCDEEPVTSLSNIELRSPDLYLRDWQAGTPNNDNSLRTAWYRTVSDGRQYFMTDSSRLPDNMECNTLNPIYLDGRHPSLTELSEIPMSFNACVVDDLYMCDISYDIKIRKCGDEVQYYLQPALAYSAYCFDLRECFSSPCENNGTCIEQVNGYVCACTPGYQGSRCQTSIRQCFSSPCENNGTCIDQVNGYTCTCTTGFQGSRCQIDIDECVSSPCKNGGTCSDHTDGYTCICKAGYTGRQCETEINECGSNPCKHGAKCLDHIDGYNCICVSGYRGRQCETEVDECVSSPCKNGATCYDNIVGYTCSCVAGYSGNQCEIDIDDCTPNPCENGAVCLDHVNNYTCSCASGYHGNNCEKESLPLVIIAATTCGSAVFLGLTILIIVYCLRREKIKEQNSYKQFNDNFSFVNNDSWNPKEWKMPVPGMKSANSTTVNKTTPTSAKETSSTGSARKQLQNGLTLSVGNIADVTSNTSSKKEKSTILEKYLDKRPECPIYVSTPSGIVAVRQYGKMNLETKESELNNAEKATNVNDLYENDNEGDTGLASRAIFYLQSTPSIEAVDTEEDVENRSRDEAIASGKAAGGLCDAANALKGTNDVDGEAENVWGPEDIDITDMDSGFDNPVFEEYEYKLRKKDDAEPTFDRKGSVNMCTKEAKSFESKRRKNSV